MAEVRATNLSTVVLLVSISDDTRVLELNWSDAATEAAAETLYQDWLTDYVAVGDGAIKGHYHKINYEEASFALPTSTAAENGEAAIIVTNITATKKATILLPFPKDTAGVVYVGSSGSQRKQVNTTSSLLAAYLDNFKTGKAHISDGEHSLGNIVRGRRA